MDKKPKIPCRVCGKLYTPCSYCQQNMGAFRWRNFACSYECAKKYIEDTIAYRESQRVSQEEEKAEKAKPDVEKIEVKEPVKEEVKIEQNEATEAKPKKSKRVRAKSSVKKE